MRAVILAASGEGLVMTLHLYCAGGSAIGLSATDAYGMDWPVMGLNAPGFRMFLGPVSGLTSILVGEVQAM